MTNTDLKKEFPFLAAIFIFALGLRIAYLVFLQRNYFFYDHPSSDVTYYQNWAIDIIRGGPSRHDVFWGLPLYPYFLATLKILTLGNVFAIRLAHLILGSLNCILLYFLARSIFSKNIARLSAFLMAANFVLIHYDWLMMPVTLLITLSLIILISILQYQDSASKRSWFLLGFLLGIAILGDSKFFIFLILLTLYLLILHYKEFATILSKRVFPLFLGVSIVLGGVIIRNKIVGEDWIFVTAQGGLSFYVGNNPQASGIFENPDLIRPTHEGQDIDQRIIAEKSRGRPLKPSQVSDYWRGKALSFILNSPAQYLKLLENKFAAFVVENEASYDIDLLLQRDWKNKLDFNSYYFLFPLALVGMLFTIRNNRETHFLNLLIVSQLVFTLLFFLTHRHRATILPVLLIFESYTIFWFLEKFKEKKFFPLATVTSALIIFLILLRPIVFKKEVVDFLSFSKTAVIFEKEGEFKRAQEDYWKALSIYPFDANVLCNLANSFVREENYSEAILYYQRALSIMPYHIDALYNLAFVYEKLKEYELALSNYQFVLELDPRSFDAHFHIGVIYKILGNCPKALSHFNETIAINPSLENHVRPLANECLSH